MSHLEIKNVTKTFGTFEAISQLSLAVEDGEFCALLGPSGCGKSTLLRMIAGLEPVSEGSVHIGGRDVTNVPPAKRSIAMVFQSYALYPHMSVRQNIGFSLSVARMPKAKIEARANEIAQMLHLEELMERKPSELSGGQRQRVAIGRSLVRDPEVFLFDEPLSNLDAKLRVQMRLEIAKLHQDLKTTMVYVTHDQVEAMTLADRIVVLDQGRISQIGTPLDLYNHPANKFVASFIGSPGMNILPVSLESAVADSVSAQLNGGGKLDIGTHSPVSDTKGSNWEVGIRPEHLNLVAPDSENAVTSGEIQLVELLGNATTAYVSTAAGQIIVQGAGDMQAKVGENVGINFEQAHLHLFSDSGQVI